SGIIRNLKKFGAHQLGVLCHSGFKMINTKDLSFRNYYISDSTAFTTIRNQAWDAAELPNNSLALTTASGFYVFSGEGDIVFRHDAYSLNDIGRKRILYGRDIFSVTNSEYLILLEENKLALFNAEKRIFHEISKEQKQWASFFPLVPNDEDGFISHYQVSSNEFISVHFLQNKIVYYNKTTDQIITSPLLVPTIEFSWESKITMLDDTSFAINGGHFGFYICHINRQTGKIKTDGKKFLGSHKIQCLFMDKDKRLWVGTSKGVLQQKLVAPLMKSYLYQPSPTDSITGGFTTAYRHKNKLYVGRFSRNQGLVIIDTATMQVSKTIGFYEKDNMWNEIRSIQMYHPDTLWIGTNAGLLWLDTRTDNYGKLNSPVKDEKILFSELNMMAPPRIDGYAWLIGPLSGLVARYHIATRTFTFFTSTTIPALPFEKVKSIAYDSYGDVWIGGHSLARWNNQQQTFDTLIRVYGGANKYNDDILTLTADGNGSLWLHNAENGLLQYRIQEKKFVAYTRKDGLPSEALETFSPVINNMLWIGSANHLTHFNTLTKKFIVYDHTDGFPDESPKSRRIYFDEARGKLYMYCKFWLVEFPVVPPTGNKSGSEILVHEIRINNDHSFFYPDGILQLKPSENNLSISFSVIDYERNNYGFAYKLNEDENWTSLNEQRNINLTALSSGRYHIQLKATGKSGEEKLKEIGFEINPPFWKTIWFLAGCGLLITGTLYYVYRRRIRKIREWANLDKQLARTEMKALHAQMNPHFISNSLNSIREMILSDENKEASHFIAKFAHLIRVTLEQSTQSFISLRNTIDYLQRYVEMEKIRNSNFACEITTDEKLDLDETILPPMLIQPFVENAIWHGAPGKGKSIKINIDFKRYQAPNGQNTQLACIIEDNGIGINESLKNKMDSDVMHQSVGIENINNRIRLLNEKYKLQCSVTIEDKSNLHNYSGTGTVVTLRTPLEIKEQ
ncbi:MAG: histidine kinase, partial [Chitinophagaceae bacterium]